MLPAMLAREIEQGLGDFLKAAFHTSSKRFRNIMEQFMNERGNLFKGPYLSFDMPFEKTANQDEPFPRIPLGFRPYRHQEIAFQRMAGESPKSSIIATGTGSGKTECFTWPILDHCLSNRQKSGVKAILIYPMNALASDQARRIAKAIWQNPSLKGEITAGLYSDEQPESPRSEMGETEVLTDREAIRKKRPDILITNYKMLDLLLVRPRDKSLWVANQRDTLKYIVVDELHTYDGAQGTDLACLLRRLKSRLDCPKGHLCCIGTSATLGQDSSQDILGYARKVFGEEFSGDALITEHRVSVGEYLQEKDVTEIRIPSPDEALDIAGQAESLPTEKLISRCCQMWFGSEPDGDVDSSAWKIALGERLDGHVFLQSLLRILRDGPAAYDDIREQLKSKSYIKDSSAKYLTTLIDTMVSLASHARRPAPASGGVANPPATSPYFGIRSQLWFRELRRIVADLGEKPKLEFSDDLNDAELRKRLPVLHCRDCGGAGWAALKPIGGKSLSDDPNTIYQHFFGYKDRLRFVLPESVARDTGARTRRAPSAVNVRICESCLACHDEVENRDKCVSCGEGKLQPACLHTPHSRVGAETRVNHDCPYCGNKDGMAILGARSTTLLSSVIATLFGSRHNDDPKLLAFSDSVQDAAHRAGFFDARSFNFVFGRGLRRFISGYGESLTLARAIDLLPEFLREGDELAYISNYTPPDQQWRASYEELINSGKIEEKRSIESMTSMLAERLSWETFAKLTYESQRGETLEKAGLISVHPEIQPIREAAKSLSESAFDKLGDGFGHMTPEKWTTFALGLLARMRQRGAVYTNVTASYVDEKGNWYGMLRKTGRMHKIPILHPRGARPTFIASRFMEHFDSISASASVTSWLAHWSDINIVSGNPLAIAKSSDIYEFTLEALAKANLLEKREIGERMPVSVWGIRPGKLLISQNSMPMRCGRCGGSLQIPKEAEDLWRGALCLKTGCGGSLSPKESDPNKAHYSRIYSDEKIRRVIAREHTGILDRKARSRIEQGFMKRDQDPWDPNMLSATSTLEMGIDIGDLSTLALCSVPPEQSSYMQRLGRTGRRDGNSLSLTVATGRPHDLYFWNDPKEMIAGEIRTPGVHLRAFGILRRQFAAFTLDRWNMSANLNEGEDYGSLESSLECIRLEKESLFPLSWFTFAQENAEDLLDRFLAMFPDLSAESPQTVEALSKFASSQDENPFALWVSSEFETAQKELDSLSERLAKIRNDRRALKRQNPPPKDLEDRLDDFRIERKGLGRIMREIKRKNVIQFLTDHGILPNYAFPEEGMHLKSIIYRSKQTTEEEGAKPAEPIVYEYVRAASAGLGDFAPNSRFYAEGHKVTIDEINLGVSNIETWRICPKCGYMLDTAKEGPVEPCPSCKSSEWKDLSQKRKLVRLRQVIANTEAKKSKIGDERDERELKFFERSLFPSFVPEDIKRSFALEGSSLPFGFEYIQKCVFREINFGESSDDKQPFTIAGISPRGGGFTLCPDCGKVQQPKKVAKGDGGEREGFFTSSHKPRCKNAKPPAAGGGRESQEEDGRLAPIFLYREFPSETIRILMPVSALDEEKGMQSFIAGINLGLRLHFKGRVDHLRTFMLSSSEGPVKKHYLYLYDTVPGGTGYLSQLMKSPDDLKPVFEEALAHMEKCGCSSDPDKDGCYRCVYAFREQARQEKTSRAHAIGMLKTILGGWSGFKKLKSLSDVSITTILESHLEAMFVDYLERSAGESGGRFRRKVINGKPGYFLKLGADCPSWDIEPQVDMDKKPSVAKATRADFLISPKAHGQPLKPVAVYLDGWETHQDTIGGDFEKRLAIMRSGEFLAWSLSYQDMEKALEPLEENRTAHVPNPFGFAFDELGKLYDIFQKANLAEVKTLLKLPAPEALLEYLKGDQSPKRLEMEITPPVLAVSASASSRSAKGSEAISAELGWPDESSPLDLLEDLGAEAHQSMVMGDGVGLAFGFHAKDPKSSLPIVLLDDTIADSDKKRRAWNGALRSVNLLQFSPRLHVALRSGYDLPSPDMSPAASRSGFDQEWSDVEELAMAELADVIRRLAGEGMPPPSVGYELVSGNSVVGMAELAWVGEKIAVSDERDRAGFESEGWRFLDCDSAARSPEALLDLLR